MDVVSLASMSSPVSIDPDILGGTPCFTGTRVPVRSLFDHLRLGYTVEAFICEFPTVRRELVDAVLELSRQSAEASARLAS